MIVSIIDIEFKDLDTFAQFSCLLYPQLNPKADMHHIVWCNITDSITAGSGKLLTDWLACSNECRRGIEVCPSCLCSPFRVQSKYVKIVQIFAPTWILNWEAEFWSNENIVKLGSLVSLTEWSNISERNSKLIENLKKTPNTPSHHPPNNSPNLIYWIFTNNRSIHEIQISEDTLICQDTPICQRHSDFSGLFGLSRHSSLSRNSSLSKT